MDPEVLRMLSILSRPLTTQIEYSQRLAESPDQYVHLAGVSALLDLGAAPRGRWGDVVRESRHGVVASSAYRFFMANFEYGLAEKVLDVFEPLERPGAAEGMRAALQRDAHHLVAVEARQFLSDGRVEHLMLAADQAETASGWREAVVWLARATVLQPTAPGGAYRLLRTLETANQFEAIEAVLDIFDKGRVFPDLASVIRGALLLHAKDPRGALQSVARLRLSEMKSAAPIRARLCQIRAAAHEALGQYRDALKWYQEFNKQGVPPDLDKRSYLATIERLGRASYPPLSADPHRDHVMMLGFPRSGTTLLEHALAAHPEVETFEEIPSLTRMVLRVEQILEDRIAGEEDRRAAFEEARQRYYGEIERRKSKPGARVFVDKLPIRTAWARLMEKFFPEQRYIFSIRHPYDVVLSCFRQSFTPNAAMENFRTLEDACDFYDRVMTIWFDAFPGEIERVLYVRYEALAGDFENEARRALDFLGVGWSDDVLRFAEFSEGRKVATPSYAKVRGGLALGVQSSWKNYRFVFDTPHGAKLHKWVERFGYDR